MAVTTDRHGRVLVVRIERPQKRNAIDAATARGIDDALNRFQDDPDLWAAVLTGTSEVFCAGTDIVAGPGEPTERGGPYGVIRRRHDKPLIAAVEGLALGGGFEIAMACDLVVASTAAAFGLPETRRGLVANSGALMRAMRCLPLNIARELLLTGTRLEAPRAHEIGFVSRLAEPGHVVEAALDLAEQICASSPTAVSATLLALEEQWDQAEAAGWAATARAEQRIADGPDKQEGLDAFAEKRPPRWSAAPVAGSARVRAAQHGRGARELIEAVIDEHTYRSWDEEFPAPAAAVDNPGYRTDLARARQRSGEDEAVLTGEGDLAGRRIAVVVNEFRFLAGSIGVNTAQRILAAVQRATARGLPLLAVTASGGTRMQEGALAFARMPAIAAAVTVHKAAGLPYVVYQRHPTTGGVLASWGSLGHLTLAEPGALIAFLGPKVYAALHGKAFPDDVQTAENLLAHGVVDAVVAPEALRGYLATFLGLLERDTTAGDTTAGDATAGHATDPADDASRDGPGPAWESVERTRRAQRPGLSEVLAQHGEPLVTLSGSGRGETADGLVVGVTRFAGTPCVLIGQDRLAERAAPVGPGSLRTVRRALVIARELDLPVVTVVDTVGAVLSVAAEQGALAGEIASCLADLATVPVPTLAVLLGQGTGGAALALLPTDRVVAARHTWLTPLPPEGASVIVHGTAERAADVVATQHIRSTDLLDAGAVDAIIDERPDAADEPVAFCRRVVATIDRELQVVRGLTPEGRVRRRSRGTT
jgi:acetyl-CoA carboxylase beta subunit/enoyl-CoA hydratase/carnithine racemase